MSIDYKAGKLYITWVRLNNLISGGFVAKRKEKKIRKLKDQKKKKIYKKKEIN